MLPKFTTYPPAFWTLSNRTGKDCYKDIKYSFEGYFASRVDKLSQMLLYMKAEAATVTVCT